MSCRDLSQPSFVDALVSGYGKGGGFLDRIDDAFDWSAFEALLAPIHASRRGAPGYPPVTLFKILLLQQWHTLSDPGAEEAVRAWTQGRGETLERAKGFLDALERSGDLSIAKLTLANSQIRELASR